MVPISPKEREAVHRELRSCEDKKATISREIGELMGSSGSFAAKTPGYSDAEDAMRMTETKIAQLKSLLAETTPIESVDDLDATRVGVYSAVTVEDGIGELSRYYICHFSSSHGPDGFTSITPKAPIAVALMGKAAGETGELILKQRRKRLKIVDVEPYV